MYGFQAEANVLGMSRRVAAHWLILPCGALLRLFDSGRAASSQSRHTAGFVPYGVTSALSSLGHFHACQTISAISSASMTA